MKVLFVAHSGDLNGAELAMCEGIEGLPAGIRALAVVPGRNGPLRNRLRSRGVEILGSTALSWLRPSSLPWPLRRHYLQDLPSFVAPLTEVIHSEAIDVVYSSSAAILHAAVAAAVTGRPHVWHVQELLARPGIGLVLPPGGAWTAYQVIRHLASVVLVPSQVLASEIGRIRPLVRVVPYGFEPAPSRPMLRPREAGTSLRILIIGTVGRRKGADILPEIVRRVCGQTAAEFYWAGAVDDGTRARLESEINSGGSVRLHLLGYRSDVPQLLADCDILLHASENESFGRVLLEAAAAGRPVVATRCGGSEEIVIDGETGFLAPVGDAPALADAILRLRDPALRASMGLAGEVHSRRFPLARYQEGFRAALDEARHVGPAVGPATASFLRHAIRVPGSLSRLGALARRPRTSANS